MISLEQALADQENLGRLCAPRKLKYPEQYWPNSNYGFSTVLKAYADVAPEEPLWGVVPHGVYLDDGHLFDGEVEAPVPAVFSYPRYRDELWEAKAPAKTVIPSAAPFLYALESMRMQGWSLPADRQGTIVFPKHSTAVFETNTRWARLADELAALPDEFQPVTVCIHWQDLARKRDAEFVRRNIPVVSAGHLSNQEFLYRMIHLMSQNRFVASNGVSSNLFYAVAMGLPYLFVGRSPEYALARGNEHLRSQYHVGSETASQRSAQVREVFEMALDDPLDEPTEHQRGVAAEYLGAERLKTPEGLRADLEYARGLRGR